MTNNNNIQELCDWVVETTKNAGADDCKVRISKRRFVQIDYREQKPETIKEATTQNLSLSLYVDGRFSSQNTPDFRKGAIESFIKKSIENTSLIEKDPSRFLPDQKYYQGLEKKDLQLFDETQKNFTPEERHEFVKRIEKACLESGGDKAISVTAGEYDHTYEEVVKTSNGFMGSRKDTECWMGGEMTAQDEGDRRPNGYFWVGSRKRSTLMDPAKIGRLAAENTLRKLGAKKIKTETLPIIIENRVASRTLGGLINAFNGRNIQQKQSFLADKKGQKIASDKLNLIDDPFIPEAMGSRLYDGDCLPSKKRVMVENGVLKEFYIDWYYSRKLEMEPTSGGTSNLVLKPGAKSIEDQMQELGRGILITEFLGGNSNSTTGDFSVGISGILFENGKPTQAVAEMNIADNHLEFWNKLADVCNDPWIYSSWRLPSLVFNDIVVAGI